MFRWIAGAEIAGAAMLFACGCAKPQHTIRTTHETNPREYARYAGQGDCTISGSSCCGANRTITLIPYTTYYRRIVEPPRGNPAAYASDQRHLDALRIAITDSEGQFLFSNVPCLAYEIREVAIAPAGAAEIAKLLTPTGGQHLKIDLSPGGGTSSVATEPERSNVRSSPTPTATPSFGSETVSAVQEALHILGYKPGPADGELGTQTANALRRFQRAKGLAPTGRPDRATVLEIQAEFGARGFDTVANCVDDWRWYDDGIGYFHIEGTTIGSFRKVYAKAYSPSGDFLGTDWTFIQSRTFKINVRGQYRGGSLKVVFTCE